MKTKKKGKHYPFQNERERISKQQGCRYDDLKQNLNYIHIC